MSIPLTIDWLTVAWLELRLRLWWRRQRWLWRALALLSLVTGCVPVTQLEEAQSAAHVEQGGRQRAEAELAAQKAENEQLRARVAEQGATLEQREQALAQAELDGSLRGKEREEAAGMVEQLRVELARTAGHLQSFHADKQQLEAARAAEVERHRGVARLTRDIALLLAAPIAAGEYALDAGPDGTVVLRMPRERVLAEDGSVKAEAAPLLEAVARSMQLNERSRLSVKDSSAEADPLKVSGVVTALGERGVAADRFEPLAAREADGAVAADGTTAAQGAAEAAPAAAPSAPAELVFTFSVP